MTSIQRLPYIAPPMPIHPVCGEERLQQAESNATKTLLYRLGGDDALEATVIRFYELVLKDPALAPFFENVNVRILTVHQKRFMRLAFTKIPDDFDVVSFVVNSHSKLFDKGLNETHFDLVAGHLVAALKEMWVDPKVVNEVVELLIPFRAAFEKQGRDDIILEATTTAKQKEEEEKKINDTKSLETSSRGVKKGNSSKRSTRGVARLFKQIFRKQRS